MPMIKYKATNKITKISRIMLLWKNPFLSITYSCVDGPVIPDPYPVSRNDSWILTHVLFHYTNCKFELQQYFLNKIEKRYLMEA